MFFPPAQEDAAVVLHDLDTDQLVCPACGVVGEPCRSRRARLMCRSCAHQSSVTAKTIFDETRTPLRVWLAAAWYVTNQKLGVSALGLKRVLGLGSYCRACFCMYATIESISCSVGVLTLRQRLSIWICMRSVTLDHSLAVCSVGAGVAWH